MYVTFLYSQNTTAPSPPTKSPKLTQKPTAYRNLYLARNADTITLSWTLASYHLKQSPERLSNLSMQCPAYFHTSSDGELISKADTRLSTTCSLYDTSCFTAIYIIELITPLQTNIKVRTNLEFQHFMNHLSVNAPGLCRKDTYY